MKPAITNKEIALAVLKAFGIALLVTVAAVWTWEAAKFAVGVMQRAFMGAQGIVAGCVFLIAFLAVLSDTVQDMNDKINKGKRG